MTKPILPVADPLSDFKEKMKEEEIAASDAKPAKNFMWPIIFIFIIALALLGGVFIYKQGVNKDGNINVVTLSPTPTFAPTPTKVKADLSKYEIEILNGTGIAGEAGRQKEVLEEKGFVISSIGNADNSNYTQTIIRTKKEVGEDFLDELKSVLGLSFKLSENEELPDDAGSDVIVILGSEAN